MSKIIKKYNRYPALTINQKCEKCGKIVNRCYYIEVINGFIGYERICKECSQN